MCRVIQSPHPLTGSCLGRVPPLRGEDSCPESGNCSAVSDSTATSGYLVVNVVQDNTCRPAEDLVKKMFEIEVGRPLQESSRHVKVLLKFAYPLQTVPAIFQRHRRSVLQARVCFGDFSPAETRIPPLQQHFIFGRRKFAPAQSRVGLVPPAIITLGRCAPRHVLGDFSIRPIRIARVESDKPSILLGSPLDVFGYRWVQYLMPSLSTLRRCSSNLFAHCCPALCAILPYPGENVFVLLFRPRSCLLSRVERCVSASLPTGTGRRLCGNGSCFCCCSSCGGSR